MISNEPINKARTVALTPGSPNGLRHLATRTLLIAASAGLILIPVFGIGPTFAPDWTFKGSSLKGWHVLGNADWRAENGELIGKAKSAGGGWLVSDTSLQDLGFYASFRCTGECKTGIMVRAEKAADGMKGDFVSLTEGDRGLYRVTLDAQGQETHREKARPVGAMIRYAEPVATPFGGGQGRGPGRGAVYHADDWNAVQVIVDADILRASLNGSGGGLGAGATEDNSTGFGQMALYVGGSGEVRFKDVSYKDLGVKDEPPEQTSSHFRMQQISEFDYSWGVAAADINHDGVLDVVAGPYYYLGPDYAKEREIYSASTFSPSTQYPATMVNFAHDFTGDGWPDVITATAGKPVNLYVNPKGEPRRWDKFEVAPRINTEITVLKDIDGDGMPDLVCGIGGVLSYVSPDPANPTGPWIIHKISGPNGVGAHGIGAGDINGDGRMDVLTVGGWYEQPAKGSQQEPWTFHPETFGTLGGADGSLRRERRRAERRSHGPQRAWIRSRLVRAETRPRWEDFVHKTHDYGRFFDQKCGKCNFCGTARFDLRGCGWRWDTGLHRGQAVLVARR